jgi:hypothetical protein
MRLKRLRTLAIGGFLALLIAGCVSQFVVLVMAMREWKNEVAPFEALGARVVATGGDDSGRIAGRAGVARIIFRENVGDSDLAVLAKRMERFPNLDTLSLEGPRVTDAGVAHLKGLKQLKNLMLLNTEVTEKGRSDLRRALPELKVP